jgi:2-aminoadipate transaminase
MPSDQRLARRTRHMSRSAIREILKVASQPGVISLAGGVPAPASFPLELMHRLSFDVIQKYADRAFQYDLTEGFTPLREALVPYLRHHGIHVSADSILITSGSQGALDALGKILISPGDMVAVESPTYLGAIQAFTPYGPRYAAIPCDDEGVIPEALDEILMHRSVKFVYLVPTFQNPSGRTLSLKRRQAIADVLEARNTYLIEDDPYSDLRYEGQAVAAIKSLIPDRVIYVGTLSKVFAPGLRIGYCIAPEPVRSWLVLAKQGVDLHTSTFDQALAAEYLQGGHLHAHLPHILALYRPRQSAMLEALADFMPPEFRWSRPQGGMFVWVEGPADINLADVYPEAIRQQVAYVPGSFFFTEPGAGLNTMRLNFTMPAPEEIRSAVRTLGMLVRSFRNKSVQERIRESRTGAECVPCWH